MANELRYEVGVVPSPDQVIKLYNRSGLRRPTDESERIARMYKESNLVVTAWHDDLLAGVSRSLTDYSFCCYLSDLAVDPDYQKRGIGRELIAITRSEIGPECMLILLSAQEAIDYYPKVGFKAINNAFLIDRTA